MMENVYYYQVDLTWAKDRMGIISSPALQTTIEVVTPPEFPKGIEGKWSPEHLFVAAVNSCLMTTFIAVAESSKLDFVHFESSAQGTLQRKDGRFMITEIILSPVLTITNPSDRERSGRILEKSEAACLISNSIKAEIIFHPRIKMAAETI